jgi:hypothetical protein
MVSNARTGRCIEKMWKFDFVFFFCEKDLGIKRKKLDGLCI